MPSPRRNALTLSLIAACLIVWLNRGIWFYGDDWAYFTIRYFQFTGGEKLEALFSPHNEHWATIGKIGQFYRRVFWRRLGMTLKLRDRVYELSMTDPVKIAIVGAELLLSPTNA